VTATFTERHGFKSDPFSSTNAETEEELQDYFVPPPYFATVLGDPKSPASNVVFAPRGAGKTAQRRMIEEESVGQGQFLCLTYDSFDFGINVLRNPTIETHLIEISRLITTGILERLTAPGEADKLDDREKQVVKAAAELFLSRLSALEYERAVRSVKSLGQRAGDFWQKYGGVVAAGIAALMKKVGLDPVQLPQDLQEATLSPDGSARYFYVELLKICRRLGWKAVYILVDKVDETPTTATSADAAFNLIRPLLVDLPTLEAPGAAFKFFLWDQTEESFRIGGGRPDRMHVVTLNWSVNELELMLTRRLLAFSDGQVDTFNQMLCSDVTVDAHKLLAYLAHGSPRDMIRMAASVIAEQTRHSGEAPCITEKSLFQGVQSFSLQRSQELYPQFLPDLQKVGEPTFTITGISSDIFRFTTQAGRSKVQKWQNAGAVDKIAELPNQAGRPTYLYGFADPRLVITVRGRDVQTALRQDLHVCGACARFVTSVDPELSCPHCGQSFESGTSRSLLDVCQRVE
jgi:hypothetical protein